MEQWKLSVLTGAVLAILAIIFAIIRKSISIWIILIIILAVIDIALGLYRKKKKKRRITILHQKQALLDLP